MAPTSDTEIERYFEWAASKYLEDSTQVSKQVEVVTQLGVFRPDFLLKNGRRQIAIECDGKDYHDLLRDEFRDAAILHAGSTPAIYRFSGAMLFHRTDDCLAFLSLCEPSMFSKRGRINLQALSSHCLRQAWDDSMSESQNCPSGEFEIAYLNEEGARIIPQAIRIHTPSAYSDCVNSMAAFMNHIELADARDIHQAASSFAATTKTVNWKSTRYGGSSSKLWSELDTKFLT